ncbi:MAG: MBL fold metallo-hydrolase [Halobacteriales archaeon]|nr:MBL fold metallo-hydrolase [Halobacteriales archaeon]
MRLTFLGGAREVGRSAVLVGDSLLVDFGVKTANPTLYPVTSPSPDAVVVSHGHLDHVGALPTLMDGFPPVYGTPPTRELARTLGEDSLKLGTRRFQREDLLRLSQAWEDTGYNQTFEPGITDYEVSFHDAGHIPGSASVLVEEDDGDESVLYTGDLNTTPTRLLDPAVSPPSADTVVVESTYFDHEHTDREELERRFVDSVRETLYEGGDVIVPVFAIGRTQEILMVLEEHDVPCYVDGMGTDVMRTLRHHPDYVRDADALKRAANHAREVKPSRRDDVLGQGRAVVTTSGMLSGGPAMKYIKEIYDHPGNKICLTGYQVEGTPGRTALDEGRAEIDGTVLPLSAQVEMHDFSAHADGNGLRSYVREAVEAGAERVLAVHGDEYNTTAFAEWAREELGVEAYAPEVGEEVTV